MAFSEQTSKQNGRSKPNENRFVDVDDASVVPEGAGPGGRAWIKGVKCMARVGSETLGGEHATVYADVR